MQLLLLSPHRDDAAFSCGLLLQRALQQGTTVHVVNVCTVSDYAPYMPADGTDRVRQVSGARRLEDERYLEHLHALAPAARVQESDLAWQDAPLRWRLEETAAVLEAQALREEEVSRLAAAFGALAMADFVLVPLALGGHVDHRLVRAAAERAFAPERILFYEDLPYGCCSDVRDEAEGLLALDLPPDSAPPRAKLDAARFYPSQIADEVAWEMEGYGRALGHRERVFATAQALAALPADWLHGGAR